MAKPVQTSWTSERILKYVLDLKGYQANPTIAMPTVIYLSKAKLAEFQAEALQQWGFKPDQMTNAYFVNTNRIYLDDDSAYYERNNRFIDDSLAHELTHYYQVKYRGWDLNDESLEWDAIDVQSQFRDYFRSKNY